MVNKKFWLGILVLTLVFGMMVVGCEEETTDEINWNSHRYKRIDQSKTWTDAKASAEALGGYLATITSAEEQKIVLSLIKATSAQVGYWLGGYRATNDDFIWITNEPMNYTNWGDGEPNNYQGIQDKIRIICIPYTSFGHNVYTGQWDDDSSDDKSGFIIEWD